MVRRRLPEHGALGILLCCAIRDTTTDELNALVAAGWALCAVGDRTGSFAQIPARSVKSSFAVSRWDGVDGPLLVSHEGASRARRLQITCPFVTLALKPIADADICRRDEAPRDFEIHRPAEGGPS